MRPERIDFKGAWVNLIPLDASAHGDDLRAGTSGEANDPLWQYLPYGPYRSRDGFDEQMRQMSAGDDPVFWAIIDKSSGRATGRASLMRIDPPNRVIEVGGILYSPALQRTSGATEAMYLMARYVFEVLGYRRYEWKCNALNAPSRAAALRLGFTYEGIFRQHMIVKGENRDSAWYSMLDGEWPARKLAFERWLDPANFDAAGRQITPLQRC
jgi:RimJ/RimL family protein N-acetyltransferase